MPEAVPIQSRFAPDVTCLLRIDILSPGRSYGPEAAVQRSATLEEACHTAVATEAAMTVLSASVAELAPSDPRHSAAYAALDLLKPRWREQLARACRLTAVEPGGLRVKASLLSSLIERDEQDAVVGGPVVQVAASLADDLLAYEWSVGR